MRTPPYARPSIISVRWRPGVSFCAVAAVGNESVGNESVGNGSVVGRLFANEEPNQMTIVELLILLLVAGICGSLAQAVVGYSRGGCLVAIVMGFIGALFGTWIARLTGLPELLAVRIGDQTFPIVWSIIGAALFAAVLSLLTRRRAYHA